MSQPIQGQMDSDHDRALSLAKERFDEALELLGETAEWLRGPEIDPSPQAMRIEMVVTRAIEALNSVSFVAPKKQR